MKCVALLSLNSQSPGKLEDYTALRLGRILSSDPSLTCVAVSIDDFSVTESRVIIHRGLRFYGGRLEEQYFGPVEPSYVFFVHVANPQQHSLCLDLLARISKQGIRTNYDADASLLGVKSILEERCREYEASSGRTIPRPKTIIVKGDKDKGCIVDFMRRVGPCIIKPHNSSRSRGVGVLAAEDQVDQLALGNNCHVVQELLSDPLRIDGYKTGLRVYLMISHLKRSYALSEQALVKLAVQPYVRGDSRAEIVGPHTKRGGSWPVIYLLNDLVRSEQTKAEWTQVRKSIAKTIDLFMEAVSWRAGMHHQLFPSMQLWGIDILIRKFLGGFEAYLIEVNTFPALYREDVFTDDAMDSVFSRELFAKALM